MNPPTWYFRTIARALARLENVGTNSCPTFSRRLIFATYPGTHASGAFVTGAFFPDGPDAPEEPWCAVGAFPSSPPPPQPASGKASASASAAASGGRPSAARLRRGRRRAVPADRERSSADINGTHLTRPPDVVVCCIGRRDVNRSPPPCRLAAPEGRPRGHGAAQTAASSLPGSAHHFLRLRASAG